MRHWLAVVVVLSGCLGAESSSDGGSDGGTRDAGGMTDAGTSDAGTSDAGTFDAGTSDAGTSDAGTSDAGTSDAGTPDAGASDAGAGAAFIGATVSVQRVYAQGPPTGTLTTAPVTTRSGSTLLVSVARGTWSAAPDVPTDSFGNTFSLVGTVHPYSAWPTSAAALSVHPAASGGPAHTFSMSWGDIGGTGDEVSLSAVEVVGASTVEASSWVERSAANTLTSGVVHVNGPAVLVAWWWGSGGVLPVGAAHVAVPGNGFTLLPGATRLQSISSNGYVQVACATKTVSAAGDYSVTWTTNAEGAQLFLVALRVP
jgi:hypothetical protein